MRKLLTKSLILVVLLPLLLVGGPASAQETAPTEPGAVFRAAVAALSAGDIDTHLSFFAEDVVSTALPPPPGVDAVAIGRAAMRSVAEGLIARNIQIEFTTFHVLGESVSFTAAIVEDLFVELGVAPIHFSGVAIIQDGRIQTETWVMQKDSFARFIAAVTSAENQAVVERLYEEVFNQKNLDVVDELYADDVVDHDLGDANREAVKAGIAAMLTGLPDLAVTTDLWATDGDLVITRITFSGTHQEEWLGASATGNTVTWTHIDIHRIQGGRITDIWHTVPASEMLQQMGFELAPSAE